MEEKVPHKWIFQQMTVIHFGRNTEHSDLRALKSETKQEIFRGESKLGAAAWNTQCWTSKIKTHPVLLPQKTPAAVEWGGAWERIGQRGRMPNFSENSPKSGWPQKCAWGWGASDSRLASPHQRGSQDTDASRCPWEVGTLESVYTAVGKFF